MSPLSAARKRANAKYNAKAYDTILIRVKRGQKEIIQAKASAAGESINAYIVRALQERMAAQDHERF